jgi:hypothetical protein|uniref:Uncharacterized protein n=1 Tax=Zea mays TaxID=4577 RepID=A0A804QRW0_MAIZE
MVAVGFFKTSFIALAIVLIDRVGRKPLLYVSMVGRTGCLAALSAALFLQARGSVSRGAGVGVAILTVCNDVAFFSVGIGPVPAARFHAVKTTTAAKDGKKHFSSFLCTRLLSLLATLLGSKLASYNFATRTLFFAAKKNRIFIHKTCCLQQRSVLQEQFLAA